MRKSIWLMLCFVLAACGTLQVGIEPTPASNPTAAIAVRVTEPAQAKSQLEATLTVAPPTQTPKPTPSPSPSATPLVTSSPMPTSPAGIRLQDVVDGGDQIAGMAFSPLNNTLYLAGAARVYTYQGETLDVLHVWLGTITEPLVAFSADGSVLAVRMNNGEIALLRLPSGEVLRTIQPNGEWPISLALSADGQMLAAALGEDTVGLWDVASGKQSATLKTADGSGVVYQNLAFSPDGKLLSGSFMSRLTFWNLITNDTFVADLGCRGDTVFDQAYTPDGKTLAVACGPGDSPVGFLTVWDVAGHLPRFFLDETTSIHSLAISPNGLLLATGKYDGTLDVRELSQLIITSPSLTSQPAAHLQGHAGEEYPNTADGALAVTALAFSADGKTLAAAAANGSIVLTDLTALLPESVLITAPTPTPQSFASSTTASGCTIPAGESIHTRAETYIWSEPDVSRATIAWTVGADELLYILAGPVEGIAVKKGEQKGWFWKVSFTPNGESAGWIGQNRIQECP